MRKRRLWLYLVLVCLVGAAVLVALLEPNRIVPGLLVGEPFYRDRPLRYWREVLRGHGRDGSIPTKTASQFWDGNAAFSVLRECAQDPDRNVRWPAIALLGHSGLRTQPALDVLVQALQDEDVEVRLKAVGALADWGPTARPAIPALITRLRDSELQVAHSADRALWKIDTPAAVVACGWRSFRSPEFGFSVMLPEEPEREDKPLLDGLAVIHSFQAWHRMWTEPGPNRYVALVAEYAEEALKGSTEEERFQALKDFMPFFFAGGKMVEDNEISLGKRRGREYKLDVEGMGRLWGRHFWVGSKVYAVFLASQPAFMNERAGAYFLDSFRLEEKAKKKDNSAPERPRSSP
jgi:hypothetical protein